MNVHSEWITCWEHDNHLTMPTWTIPLGLPRLLTFDWDGFTGSSERGWGSIGELMASHCELGISGT